MTRDPGPDSVTPSFQNPPTGGELKDVGETNPESEANRETRDPGPEMTIEWLYVCMTE